MQSHPLTLPKNWSRIWEDFQCMQAPYHRHDKLIPALSWIVCLLCHQSLYATSGCYFQYEYFMTLGVHRAASIRLLCVNRFVDVCNFMSADHVFLCVCVCVCVDVQGQFVSQCVWTKQLAPGVSDHGGFVMDVPHASQHSLSRSSGNACVCVNLSCQPPLSRRDTHTPRGKQTTNIMHTHKHTQRSLFPSWPAGHQWKARVDTQDHLMLWCLQRWLTGYYTIQMFY